MSGFIDTVVAATRLVALAHAPSLIHRPQYLFDPGRKRLRTLSLRKTAEYFHGASRDIVAQHRS